MEIWSRRKFFLASLASSFAAGAGKVFGRPLPDGPERAAISDACGAGTRHETNHYIECERIACAG